MKQLKTAYETKSVSGIQSQVVHFIKHKTQTESIRKTVTMSIVL